MAAANTDALTQVCNRRCAEEYISKELRSTADMTYCVAMIDVDKFKQINDTLGHDGGDQVLIYISSYFHSHLRKGDMIFRWGGDEFLIILKNVTLRQAHYILDKLRIELYHSAIQIKEQEVHISISVGVSEFDIHNPQKSIEACDQNLYKGKRSGRNIVFSGM